MTALAVRLARVPRTWAFTTHDVLDERHGFHVRRIYATREFA